MMFTVLPGHRFYNVIKEVPLALALNSDAEMQCRMHIKRHRGNIHSTVFNHVAHVFFIYLASFGLQENVNEGSFIKCRSKH